MTALRLFPVAIPSVQDWPSNGHLIADVVELGYIQPDDTVLDVTYGRGNWWTRHRPTHLVEHDLALDGVDFRDLPESDGSVDVVAFDPPYVPQGGTTHEETHEFRDRFGLNGAPTNRLELTELILDGFAECCRVVRPGGIVLVKCQPFQSGKKFHHVPAIVIGYAEDLGVSLIDELVHRRNTGPTSCDRFNHSRSNRSHLLVFRRRRRAARAASVLNWSPPAMRPPATEPVSSCATDTPADVVDDRAGFAWRCLDCSWRSRSRGSVAHEHVSIHRTVTGHALGCREIVS